MDNWSRKSEDRPLRNAGAKFMICAAAFAAAVFAFSPLTASAEQREFNLTIDEVKIPVAPGLDYQVFAFNGQVPGPLIHVKEGDEVTVHVTNNTTIGHSIHWHGIYQLNNWQNDGVHGVTQKSAIEPGEAFTYKWRADKTGSLWYHCHMNVNEHVGIRGMWGPLVVDPKKPTELEKRVTQDVIMMYSSWDSTFADKLGFGGGPLDRVNYFSVNAKSFPMNQPIRVKKGDVVRLRFYGAGGEIHSMHPHGHDMLITHKDGRALPSPYYADTILFGPGERYDAIVEANNPGRFMFHDHVDPHVTNNGKFPGGPTTVIEYDEIPVDDWYDWKGVVYDPDFYYTESMKKGYGIFEHDAFKGTPLTQERRRAPRSEMSH